MPSSFLSDGATACLLATEGRAKQLGLAGKAIIRSYAYASQVAFGLIISRNKPTSQLNTAGPQGGAAAGARLRHPQAAGQDRTHPWRL